MSAPDPEGMSLLAKILAAGAPVAAAAWGFVKLWDKKADKKAVAEEFKEVKSELQHQRGVQGKIFDQIRDNEKASETRHRELLMHLVKKGD